MDEYDTSSKTIVQIGKVGIPLGDKIDDQLIWYHFTVCNAVAIEWCNENCPTVKWYRTTDTHAIKGFKVIRWYADFPTIGDKILFLFTYDLKQFDKLTNNSSFNKGNYYR